MPVEPYRSPPPVEPTACCRCHGRLSPRTGAYAGGPDAPLCERCFFGQYDLLALFGMGAIGASAITESAVFLVGAILVHGMVALAIHYRGL
ncbi:MAG: hypothetical protein U0359_23445 [Byssovorax sp.]